jgi:hypothetical protein
LSAEISQYDQNGEAWDVIGGMPDPLICFFKNMQDMPTSLTQAEVCTSTKQDTFTPIYNEYFETQLYQNDSWLIIAYDEDVTDYEYIEGAIAEPIEVDFIKSGGFHIQSDYLKDLQVQITPVE